jgi:hypothetical protein
MFIGAVGAIALSHLPGLPVIAGAAIGTGAMTAGMLQLPLTAVLITTLFLGADLASQRPPAEDRRHRRCRGPYYAAAQAQFT